MKYIKYLAIPAIVAFTIITTSCFDSRKTGVKITVPTDRNVSSYYIKVSGPGMETIEETFSKNIEKMVLDVPAGKSRLFEVIAYIDPSDSSAALSFRGTATLDLEEGSAATLPVSLSVYETKLIIPDPNNTPKIIQITDFNNPDWKELNTSNFTNITDFRPYDIDFDSKGRIYIANNRSSVANEMVVRIDNFDNPNDTVMVGNVSAFGVKAIAIDRKNGYIYHTRGTDLRRTDISSPGIGTAISVAAFSTPQFAALAVDEEGMLYIADYSPNQIVKLDPDNPLTFIKSYTSNIDFINDFGTFSHGDIYTWGDSLFIANLNGITGYKVLELDKDTFTLLNNYGTATTSADISKGMFYGPHLFVGIRNDKFYMVDEYGENGLYLDKLISMDDMSGTNWTIFDPTSIGQTAFDFYYDC